jgi:hypothetical protein
MNAKTGLVIAIIALVVIYALSKSKKASAATTQPLALAIQKAAALAPGGSQSNTSTYGLVGGQIGPPSPAEQALNSNLNYLAQQLAGASASAQASALAAIKQGVDPINAVYQATTAGAVQVFPGTNQTTQIPGYIWDGVGWVSTG